MKKTCLFVVLMSAFSSESGLASDFSAENPRLRGDISPRLSAGVPRPVAGAKAPAEAGAVEEKLVPDRIQKTEVRRQNSVVCSRSSVLCLLASTGLGADLSVLSGYGSALRRDESGYGSALRRDESGCRSALRRDECALGGKSWRLAAYEIAHRIQKTEVRIQKPEVRSQKSEFRLLCSGLCPLSSVLCLLTSVVCPLFTRLRLRLGASPRRDARATLAGRCRRWRVLGSSSTRTFG